MSGVHNDVTKLLATGLNNIAVAFVVIGVSFGIAGPPMLRPVSVLRGVLALQRNQHTLDSETRSAEPQSMSAGETFVIPVVVTAIAYAAMLANERAVRRSDREPGK